MPSTFSSGRTQLSNAAAVNQHGMAAAVRHAQILPQMSVCATCQRLIAGLAPWLGAIEVHRLPAIRLLGHIIMAAATGSSI
jgi:hypothetical protein